MESLRDKVAVVTGAGSGIGRATARSLGRRGTAVVVADINADRASSVADEIRAESGRSAAMACDVAVDGAFERLRDVALERFGRVDIVMNNVGVLTRGLPEHLPLTEWQRIIDTNLMSYVRSNIVFLPLLLEQGHGHIVNTASFAGLFTYSYDRLPYAVSKAGVIQLSEGLRLYLAPRGIGVTVLCPGPVITNIIESLPPSFGPEPQMPGPGDQFGLLTPDEVGERVIEAIAQDTFMVYTHPEVRDVLVDRASDWNAFIDEQARTI
ncbi:SDR family NAD(P)-dependent oxidoreductase [Mycolicibacterium elephantis]|uniref:SDR family NAD(P)-dependent oxidoreductase n=1 Tax=Mycolicibacterium elephantis TaxID=81858 RepID=UPI0006291C4E|nr:SDR family NAD(P)-dependent oxidoreductase [Mycolicibacterium elephantis]KKW65166.1 short-chain dehydrogenase [Mycolicibacterium elephantis]